MTTVIERRLSFVVKTKREIDVDMSSEEEEEETEYKKGGYHPVDVGDIFNGRYQVVSKLGWGHFSTVWLAKDLTNDTSTAIKVVKSARHYTAAARDEVKILQVATSNDPENCSRVIHLLDTFDVQGPNGTHVAMIFEKLGCNLLTLIRMYRYRGLPLPLVRMITKQMVVAMEFLHRCSIIHTDLKPENMLLVKTPQNIKSLTQSGMALLQQMERRKRKANNESDEENNDESSAPEESGGDPHKGVPWTASQLREVYKGDAHMVKIVDLGNACWTFEHFTDDVQTRQYRAPEVIIGSDYTTAIDIWSMACIVFELLTGDLLFEPKAGRTFGKDDDHMAQIFELLGPMPTSMSLSGRSSHVLFTATGELRSIKNLKHWPLVEVLQEKYKFSSTRAQEISDFLLPMLRMIPTERATAADCLQSPWIRDITPDNFEECLVGWD